MRAPSSPEMVRRLPPAPSSVVNISGSVVESHAWLGCLEALTKARTAMARRDAGRGVDGRGEGGFVGVSFPPKIPSFWRKATNPKASATATARAPTSQRLRERAGTTVAVLVTVEEVWGAIAFWALSAENEVVSVSRAIRSSRAD